MKIKANARIIIAVLTLSFLVFYVINSVFMTPNQELYWNSTRDESDMGYFYLYSALENLGYDVKRWSNKELPNDSGLVIFMNYNSMDEEFLIDLEQQNYSPDLLIINNGSIIRDYYNLELSNSNERWFEYENHYEQYEVELGPWTNTFQTENSALQRLMRFGDGELLLKKQKANFNILLFSEPYIFTNRNLNTESAIVLNSVLQDYYESEIIFYEYSNLTQFAQNPVSLLFQGNLLVPMIHLLLIGILFSLRTATPFGQILNVNQKIRRDTSQHLEAVGDFFRKTKQSVFVGQMDLDYFRQRLEQIFSYSKQTPDNEFIQKLIERIEIEESEAQRAFKPTENENELYKVSKLRKNILKQLSKR